MSTAQATKNCITLKGSAQIIVEYLSKYRKQQQNEVPTNCALSLWRPVFVYCKIRVRHQFDIVPTRHLSGGKL